MDNNNVPKVPPYTEYPSNEEMLADLRRAAAMGGSPELQFFSDQLSDALAGILELEKMVATGMWSTFPKSRRFVKKD